MAAVLIDTLSLVTQLRTTGFTSQQANGLARALCDSVFDKIATKHDFDGFRTATSQEMGSLGLDLVVTKTELKQDISELKQDMVKLRIELKQDMEKLRIEVKQDMDKLRIEVRQDMDNLRIEVKQDIEASTTELKSYLEKKLAETKTEMIRWFLGSTAGMSALIVGLLKVSL